MKILAFLGAAAVGFGIAFLNYLILKYFLDKKPALISVSSVVRQLLSVLYLVALYFLGEKTVLPQWYLLIGGAVGVTLPTFWFTLRLTKSDDTKGSD